MRTFAAFSAALILAICASLSVAQDEEYELQISATVLELKVDTRTHVDMQAGDVDLQGFSVEVPDGTKSVYVNVLEATADIDLMLCDAKLESIDDLDEHSVCEFMTGRVNEVLTYTLDDGLKPGKFVVYAGTLAAYEDEEVSFDILLSFNSKPKLEVPKIPFKAQSELTPLQRAVAASVMLYTEEGAGGSGTVVSPDGLILTNHHVIESESGDSLKQVWVSFVPDARKLPVQTHIANVIMDDAELDLALLQIATDLDGNKIEKPDFVWLALAEAECELGDEIRCLGYPAIGGNRSLTSITLTRGVVSGFDMKKGKLQWYKSDCLLSAGNSGGTAINANFELAGIPTETLQDPETMEALSYIRPVQSMPAKWFELIKKAVK